MANEDDVVPSDWLPRSLEAEKRGLTLPPAWSSRLAEARKRNLVPPSGPDPKTGDTTTSDEQSLTYPFRHPIDFAKKQGLTLAGAGEGAAAAATAAAPLAAMTGPAAPLVEGAAAVAGAAVGGGAGKMAQSGFEDLGNAALNWIEPGTAPGPKTVKQVLAGGKAAAQSMAIGEAVGRPVGAAIGATTGYVGGKVAKPLAVFLQKHTLPNDLSPELTEALRAANAKGVLLTPGQWTQNTTLLKVETALRNLPLVADVMADFDRKQAAQLRADRTKISSSMVPTQTPYAAGVASKEVLERHVAEVDVAQQAASDAAKADFEKGTVASAQAKNAAEARLEQKLKAQRAALAPGGARIPSFPEQRGWTVSRSLNDQQDVYLGARAGLYEQARLAKGDPDAPLVHTALTTMSDKITGGYAEKGTKGTVFTLAKRLGTPEAEEAELGGQLADPRVAAMARKAGALPQAPKAEPGTMTVAQAINESKSLGELEFKARFESGAQSREALEYGQLKHALESDIDAHFQDNSEAKRLGGLAKAFHADYAERFRNDTVASMYGASPVKTFNAIMESKNFEAANTLRKALGPSGREIMQRHAFDEIFGGQDSIPDEKAVVSKFAEYGSAIRAILSPKQQEEFQAFALGGFSEKEAASGAAASARTFEAPKFIDDEYTAQVRSLAKRDPQSLTKELVPAPSGGDGKTYPTGNVLLAKAAKKALPLAVMDLHRSLLVENILTGVGSGEGGLKGILNRFHGYDQDYLAEMLGKEKAAEMGQLGSSALLLPVAADLASKNVGQTIGAMYVTGMVLRAPVVLGGPVTAVLATAPIITKAYLSSEGRQYLTTLLRMAPDDPRAGKIVSDFMVKFGAKTGAQVGAYAGRIAASTRGLSSSSLSTRRIPGPDLNMSILHGVKDTQP